MKIELATNSKLVITVAPTSGIQGPEANPNLPREPDEIVEAVYQAYLAGASVAHIHVRPDPGLDRVDVDVYGEVISRIRERCDIVIELDNIVGLIRDGDRNPRNHSLEERLRLLEVEPRPDMMTIMVGAFTSSVMGPLPEAMFNPPPFVAEYIAGCAARGIAIDFEVNEYSHIYTALNLASQIAFKGPYHWTFMLRGRYTLPPLPAHVMQLVECIPENSTWQIVGLRNYQLLMSLLAIAIGGCVRVGMEDNVYYERGVLARDNSELVARIVRIARDAGRAVATPADARQILGL